jgi:PD-(D/E)XK nuclease superfamily
MERSQPFVQLSQTHLQVLSTCPRKFQSLFLDQLALPQVSTSSEPQQLGMQFHQLMQQRELGLDIQPLLADNPQLQKWFHHFQDFPPPTIAGTRQSEHPCTLAFQDFILVAVYDLLIQDPDQAQIIDWKTYRRPPHTQTLQQHWQTRLYPFLLAETSQYQPEQISMIYWFAEPSGSSPLQGNWIAIPYSSQLHRETQADLANLLNPLHQWIQDFTQNRTSFPQVPLSAGHCESRTQQCPFISHCLRNGNDKAVDLFTLIDMNAIAEVSLPS